MMYYVDESIRTRNLFRPLVTAGPIADERFKSQIGAGDTDGWNEDPVNVRFVFGKPIEKERQCVDLIIMAAIWKG
jgi:hypothetical protein